MGCCPSEKQVVESCHPTKSRKDYLYFLVLVLGSVFYFGHLLNESLSFVSGSVAHLFHSFYELFNLMFLGLVFGVVFVGILSFVPREYVISVLGRPGKKTSILKATLSGLLLDLCSHGILMVGMKLYERGASLGQTMAFLIASPWNSWSLTIILVSLIGLKWTISFILLSGVIAILSGFIFDYFEKTGILPKNPNHVDLPDDFNLWENLKGDFKNYRFSWKGIFRLILTGIKESKMILKWILFGGILSSVIQVFVDQGIFQEYFGPSLFGLGATLIVTTLLEVCSEGATPLAADLINRAAAPGNAFTFLMAGVSTDYTEILALHETTRSWKIAFFLPLVTVPQVLLVGLILNGTI
ncbi:MAG: ATPase [Bdellovibrionaceae bacterium]|nr:ATPase [Pseudobdellovibrionaceae bacterium]|tara:strand:+ start:837 stop:1901 length:1065 start_codon:yes stop_codon:yes gene_type:complete